MANTPLLGLPQVTPNQNNKEVTINDAIVALEGATNGNATVTYGSEVTMTLSEAVFTRSFLFTADVTTADAILQVPTTIAGAPSRRIFAVRNKTGYGLTVRSASGTGGAITIPDEEARLLCIADDDVIVAAQPSTPVSFLALGGTPDSFTGKAGLTMVVSEDETSLIFAAPPTGLNDLDDVDTTGATNAQVLVFQSGQWIPGNFPAQVTTLLGLSDVPDTYEGAGKYLRINGANNAIEFGTINQVPGSGTAGQVLTKQGDGSYAWDDQAVALPTGGTTGQLLRKHSDTDGDAEWHDAPVALPAGGTTNQILTKQSATEGDAAWEDAPVALPTGGTTGQFLKKTSSTDGDAEWDSLPEGEGLYRFGSFFAATPLSSEPLLIHDVTDDFTLPANMVGSQVKVKGVNPAASWVADLSRDHLGVNTTIGTISIATNGVVTLATTAGADIAFVAGDVITLTAPADPDNTITNVTFSFRGNTPFGGIGMGEGVSLPAGGTTGQFLAKASGADGDAEWVDAPTGGGGSGGSARVLASGRFNASVDPTAPTIDGQFNIASITRVSTGLFEITFTTDLTIPLEHIGISGTGKWAAASGNTDVLVVGVDRNFDPTASKVRIATHSISAIDSGNGEGFDPDDWFTVEVFDVTAGSGDAAESLPVGGTTGQVLAKASNTDGDAEWVDAPSGGGATGGMADVPAATMWRLRFPDGPRARLNGTDFGVGLSELRFLDGSNANITTGGTPFASSLFPTGSGFSLAAAFDSSTATSDGWYATQHPPESIDAYIGYTFATAVTPAKVSFAPLKTFPDTFPVTVVVEFYDEATGWNSVMTIRPSAPADDTFQTFTLPAQYATGSLANGTWANKGIAVIGDSITENAPSGVKWTDVMFSHLGNSTHIVDGVGGTTMASAASRVAAMDLATTDLLLIYLGTNDYGNSGGRALGALGDTGSSNTFYGDVYAAIAAAHTANPSIRLGFLAPIQRTDQTAANTQGKVLKDYVDALIIAANAYGCPVFDMYRNGGFNSLNMGDLTVDNLHPNGAGMIFLGRAAAAWAGYI